MITRQWEPSLFFRGCRLLLRVQILLGLVIFCYNHFYLNYVGMEILLWVGWVVGLAGLIFFVLGLSELKKEGSAAEGESLLLTTTLVDRGVYAVVRHPEYLGSLLLVVGSVLISQHWLTLGLGLPLLVWFFVYVLPEEEKGLIEKFGDHYKRYRQNVPSINFLIGIIRLQKRRKRKG